MDYLKIVLDGYCDPNDREFLGEYFQDELQKAKQSPERFFNGLNKAVQALKEISKKRMNERKRELYLIDNEETKQELAEISPDDFPINLLSVTGNKYGGHITYGELEFIETVINRAKHENEPESQQPGQQKTGKAELSVPDWTIIFYYLDEAGTKEESKIDRMEKFIEENNVINPFGRLTTKGYFKKEYHKIENQINGKNRKEPLPPERIKTILPYLENNKKALQSAKSDIDYLTDETE